MRPGAVPPTATPRRMRPPDYTGGGLVNVVAELERRLTGTVALARACSPIWPR